MPGLGDRIKAEKAVKDKKATEEAYKNAETWYDRYRICFGTRQGKKVLEDILWYIGGGRTTAVKDNFGRVDPVAMGIREGRRQVENHINGRLTKPMRHEEVNDE